MIALVYGHGETAQAKQDHPNGILLLQDIKQGSSVPPLNQLVFKQGEGRQYHQTRRPGP